MRRFFVQNIFFLILINLVVKPVWIFGIDIRVQNTVGHEVYGQYQTLLNISIIFQILLDFGLQNYNNRVVSQSPRTIATLMPNMLLAKAILSAFYLALMIILGLLMGYQGFPFYLLLLLSGVQILQSLLLFLRSNISAYHHFKTDSILSVTDRFFMIAICSVLLFVPVLAGSFRIEWFVYAQLLAYLLTAFIAFLFCVRLARFHWRQYDLRKVWVICKSSLPYALLILLMALYIRADMIIIERFLPDGALEAGKYAAAFRLLDVSNNMSGVLFAGILLPVFGRMLALREDIGPIVRLSINILMPLAITMAIAALFYGNDIMNLLYHDTTIHDGRVFAILMMAFPGFCIGYVYATLLTANGSIRQLIRISLVAVVFNLAGNLLFIPVYGILGAAWICCGTQVVISVMNVITARRIIKLKQDRKWLFQYLVFTLVLLPAGYFLQYLPVNFVLQLLLLAGIALVTMVASGFLPLKKVKELLYRNE